MCSVSPRISFGKTRYSQPLKLCHQAQHGAVEQAVIFDKRIESTTVPLFHSGKHAPDLRDLPLTPEMRSTSLAHTKLEEMRPSHTGSLKRILSFWPMG